LTSATIEYGHTSNPSSWIATSGCAGLAMTRQLRTRPEQAMIGIFA
jgi:hypothetical protein